MMNKKAILITLIIIVIPIILMGCGSREPSTPTTNPDLVYTAAAQAAEATLTQIFKSTPSATPVPPTPTNNPTQTAAAQTASAMLTQAAVLSLTPQGTPLNTPVPTLPAGPSGDRAFYVKDVTIPDGSVIAPGAAFVRHGSCRMEERRPGAPLILWRSSAAIRWVPSPQYHLHNPLLPASKWMYP
jgi:hypothetical protein